MLGAEKLPAVTIKALVTEKSVVPLAKEGQ